MYKLVANGYCVKKKINKYISSLDYIIYVLSHVTKMQLFLSQLRANDVLSRVLIFDYLNYFYFYF
jgi:ABC-type branched-subunit amino acid transport system substrate-binding protein